MPTKGLPEPCFNLGCPCFNLAVAQKKRYQNQAWEVETWTNTCGLPLPEPTKGCMSQVSGSPKSSSSPTRRGRYLQSFNFEPHPFEPHPFEPHPRKKEETQTVPKWVVLSGNMDQRSAWRRSAWSATVSMARAGPLHRMMPSMNSYGTGTDLGTGFFLQSMSF